MTKALYETKLCPACGEWFSRGTTEGHKTFEKRKTCSRECAFALRRQPTPEAKPCAICGALMVYSTDEGRKNFAKRKVCSKACRNEYNRVPQNKRKRCAFCDNWFSKVSKDSITQWNAKRTCSRKCKASLKRQQSLEHMPVSKLCPECGIEFTIRPNQKACDFRKQKYCSFDCGKGHGPPPTPVEIRFWSKVLIGEEDECWGWLGSCDRNGYGFFTKRWGASPYRAHRYSWEALNGPVPEGLVIRHLCNNPSCVNPHHLKPGTQRENIIDKSYAGTQYKQKLSVDDVITIRQLRDEGYTYKQLADLGGVSESHVSQICRGRAWVHLL